MRPEMSLSTDAELYTGGTLHLTQQPTTGERHGPQRAS